MSSRGPFAPAILGKIAAAGASLMGERSSRSSAEKSVGGPEMPQATAAATAERQHATLSINHLPQPSELPVAGLDETA